MAQLLVRGLNDDVHQWLREEAARKGMSLEAEAREILTLAHDARADDPIAQVMAAMRGGGAEPVDLQDQAHHEHADFS